MSGLAQTIRAEDLARAETPGAPKGHSLTIDAVSHRFGDFLAVDNVNRAGFAGGSNS